MAAEASELGRRIRALLSRDGLPAPLTRARAFAAWLGAFGSLCAVSSLAAAPEAELARRGGAGGVALAPPDTIDARLQAIAEDEARRARSEWQAERVAVVILEPGTGRLRAMIDPNTPVLLASTLKPLTVALALDRGSITAEQVFDCGGGQRSYGAGSRGPLVLRDVGQHRSLDARRILGVSSNIGVSRIFDRLGGERFARGLSSFHLQAPAHIEDGSFEGAMLAIGARLVATPVALAAAYAVFANDGLYIAPSSTTHPMSSERVISEPTARALRGMLEGAVHDAGASGRLASVPGVRVAGKTGTSDGAEHVVLFAGMLPADAPRFVIVVTVAGAKKRGTGASVAAPLFSRIAGRAIAE
jgi:cell division protein FtsI (penicillin-binding protein 3)